jgi:hypothetical protein
MASNQVQCGSKEYIECKIMATEEYIVDPFQIGIVDMIKYTTDLQLNTYKERNWITFSINHSPS